MWGRSFAVLLGYSVPVLSLSALSSALRILLWVSLCHCPASSGYWKCFSGITSWQLGIVAKEPCRKNSAGVSPRGEKEIKKIWLARKFTISFLMATMPDQRKKSASLLVWWVMWCYPYHLQWHEASGGQSLMHTQIQMCGFSCVPRVCKRELWQAIGAEHAKGTDKMHMNLLLWFVAAMLVVEVWLSEHLTRWDEGRAGSQPVTLQGKGLAMKSCRDWWEDVIYGHWFLSDLLSVTALSASRSYCQLLP